MTDQTSSQLLKMNNLLSHKRVDIFEIEGACDDLGRITYSNSSGTIEYNDDLDYYVTLLSAELVSYFNNIIKDQND